MNSDSIPSLVATVGSMLGISQRKQQDAAPRASEAPSGSEKGEMDVKELLAKSGTIGIFVSTVRNSGTLNLFTDCVRDFGLKIERVVDVEMHMPYIHFDWLPFRESSTAFAIHCVSVV